MHYVEKKPYPFTGGHINVMGSFPLLSRKVHDAVLFPSLCEHGLQNPINSATCVTTVNKVII